MEKKELLTYLKQELKSRERIAQKYNWKAHARENQRQPLGDWRVWLILAGRGFGKTRTGAETLREWVSQGLCKRLALVADTEDEARHVMVEGESGLLNIHHPKERPLFEPSKGQLTWPNGSIASCFSAEAYEKLRGPQFDGAWVDELAKFKNAQYVWDQLMFCLRLGKMPRVIVTTTPKPIPLIKNLLNEKDVVVTRGSTFDNAKNLAKPFLHFIKQNYERTTLGRQEIFADIIEKNEGSLWSPELLEKARKSYRETNLKRIVIGIDPAVTSGDKSDETGIIVAGLTDDGSGVVLEDLSMKAPAHIWIQRAIEAYHRLKADRIIAEVNMGGDLVEQLIRSHDKQVSYRSVRATRGKYLRAEPIAALYERGKVWHATTFENLENQMCTYVPGSNQKSPDRLDALVWALTDLMLSNNANSNIWGTYI
jgi:phage terminase large subunit-like protein